MYLSVIWQDCITGNRIHRCASKVILCLLLVCSLMMCANNRVHYGPIVVSLSLRITLPHYHIMQTYIFWLEWVPYVKRVLSLISFMEYKGMCVSSLPISLMMIVGIRVLNLIIKSVIWPICHWLGLDHETMVCPVCLSIFILTDKQKIDLSPYPNKPTQHKTQVCIIIRVDRAINRTKPLNSVRSMVTQYASVYHATKITLRYRLLPCIWQEAFVNQWPARSYFPPPLW